ncbi:MAG: c-type cytochrome [Aggregatilineales bacterium]
MEDRVLRLDNQAHIKQAGLHQRLILITIFLSLVLGLSACLGDANQSSMAMQSEHQSLEGGDSERGQQLLYDYGCGSCHTIPGVPGANTYVGPPLNEWSQRHYIAGSLPNTPENLITWIQNPQQIEPGTAMPILGVNEQEARHMSAYLYSLGN